MAASSGQRSQSKLRSQSWYDRIPAVIQTQRSSFGGTTECSECPKELFMTPSPCVAHHALPELRYGLQILCPFVGMRGEVLMICVRKNGEVFDCQRKRD